MSSSPEKALPRVDASEPRQPPERFPHGLRQTWEIELLISGAVVFALLQLPSVLDRTFDRLDPHLEGTLETGLLIVYCYLALALYTLIGSFILHLAARGYWVGLIGLEAVFPQGVQWERSQYGPIGRRFYEERAPSLPTLIARVDDFCSTIFSFAFMLVFGFIASTFWAGLLGLAAFSISRLLFGGERLGDIFQALIFLLFVPLLLTPVLDKAIGKKLDPAGRPARLLLGVTGFYHRAFLMDLYSPISNVLFTNVRKQVMYPVFIASFLVLMMAFVGAALIRNDRISLDSEIYRPEEPGEHEVGFRYYESLRPAGEVFRNVPSIQADVIRDPYVKLFIPYYPRRHNPFIEKRCPGVRPLREGGFRLESRSGNDKGQGSPEAVLRCFAGIHRVALDGKPIASPSFHFYTHPKTGLRGIVTYIPTAGLSRGSHLLRVEAVPRPEPKKGEKPPQPDLIRFWR
jgi:hypothetical protein